MSRQWEPWQDREAIENRWRFAIKRGAPALDDLNLDDGDYWASYCDTHYCEIERRGNQYRVKYTRDGDGA